MTKDHRTAWGQEFDARREVSSKLTETESALKRAQEKLHKVGKYCTDHKIGEWGECGTEALMKHCDGLQKQLEETSAQAASQQEFIESVMANIGAGATLNEVTDMLCDWWDARPLPSQCLRNLLAKAFTDGARHVNDLCSNGEAMGVSGQDADDYAEKVRRGAQ